MPDDSTAPSFRDGTCRSRDTKVGPSASQDGERELGFAFSFAGYYWNEVKWLCLRVPHTMVDEKEYVQILDSLDILGMPPHTLRLKIGSLVILLRNLNPPRLCNGTRFVIKRITGNLLEATILILKFKGLSCVATYSTDNVKISNTIQEASIPNSFGFLDDHKYISQSQTMYIWGWDVENPRLSHGTAMAGSDVVQSGRPIFDDFFQHLWPYIGNNNGECCLPNGQAFVAYPHRPMVLHSPKENSPAVLNHKILEVNSQGQNGKLGGQQTCLSINRLWHELCDMLRRLVGTTAPGHHDCSIQE
ncbi:ATP-dependent DNA helicase [Trichonephila clavipes]|nr:ATP-dependent DNA helicase [Trichonephila clavipes]